jgi:hypothetical protein
MSVSDYDLEIDDLSSISTKDVLQSPGVAASEEKIIAKDGSKAAFIDVTERQRSHGDPIITPTSLVAEGRERDKPFTKYALLLRRKIDATGEQIGTQLEIRSEIIQEALQQLLKSCSYLNLVTTPIIVRAPYAVLFQFRHEIRDYAASRERKVEEKAHLKELVQFMNVNLEKLEKEYNEYAPSGLTTFSLLWTLFRPETLIVHQTDHYKECFRVRDCNVTIVNGINSFAITAWSWGYNGISFGPTRSTIHIPEFQGVRRVTELAIFPFDALASPEKELARQLIARGRIWRHSVDLCHRQYCGE